MKGYIRESLDIGPIIGEDLAEVVALEDCGHLEKSEYGKQESGADAKCQ